MIGVVILFAKNVTTERKAIVSAARNKLSASFAYSTRLFSWNLPTGHGNTCGPSEGSTRLWETVWDLSFFFLFFSLLTLSLNPTKNPSQMNKERIASIAKKNQEDLSPKIAKALADDFYNQLLTLCSEKFVLGMTYTLADQESVYYENKHHQELEEHFLRACDERDIDRNVFEMLMSKRQGNQISIGVISPNLLDSGQSLEPEAIKYFPGKECKSSPSNDMLRDYISKQIKNSLDPRRIAHGLLGELIRLHEESEHHGGEKDLGQDKSDSDSDDERME